MANVDFEQVVNLHYASLYRFALSLTRDETEAWDLVQQTCYLWATRGHQLRDAAKLKAWLLTTLHREFLGTRRHLARFPHFEVSGVTDQLPHVSPDTVNGMDGRAVMEALLQVDELYRSPLALFYLEDLSYKEIAALLDVPAGTVMSRLSRGKEQLRELLGVTADERPKATASRQAEPEKGTPAHG